MSKTKTVLAAISYWIWWILASVVGITVGLTGGYLIFQTIKFAFGGMPPVSFAIVALPTAGLGIAIFEWLLLRRWIPESQRWMWVLPLASVMAAFLWAIVDAVYPPTYPWYEYEHLLGYPIIALASFTLWLAARRIFTRSTGWWLMGTIWVFTLLFAFTGQGFSPAYFPGREIVGLIGFLAFALGGPAAALTGLVVLLVFGKVFIWRKPELVSEQDGKAARGAGPSIGELLFIHIGAPLILIVLILFGLAISGPVFPRYYDNRGLEVTPQEYTAARERWAQRPFSRYRLVASIYLSGMDYCRVDVEVEDEEVVRVFEQDCDGFHPLTVSYLFDFFAGYVGKETTRPEVRNGCDYYYVDAIFDRELGYPHYLENLTILGVSEREQYASRLSSYACVLFGPPHNIARIESLIPLP